MPPTSVRRALRLRLLAAFAVLASTAPGRAQSKHLRLLAHVPMPPCTTADVWNSGSLAVVARRYLGFSVVDASNPAQPVVRTIAPPGYPAPSNTLGCNDVKIDGRYLFVSNEITLGGFFIYDLDRPLKPRLLKYYTDRRLQGGVHNMWIDGDWLYCAANASRRVEIYDIARRDEPIWVASLGDDIRASWAHDVTVIQGRAYCAFVLSGFAVYDVRNPRRPRLLGQAKYPNALCHNVWPTTDGRYIYSTDESPRHDAVKIWDATALPRIVQIGQLKFGPPGAVPHNAIVHGNYLFLSHYKEGVRICSLNDPRKPVEIAYYDTWPSSGGGCWPNPTYAGTWGVSAWGHDLVFASDLDSGLRILRLEIVRPQLFARPQQILQGGNLVLTTTLENRTLEPVEAFGLITLSAVDGRSVGGLLGVPVATNLHRLPPLQRLGRITPLHIPLDTPVGMRLRFTHHAGLPDIALLTGRSTTEVTVR